ncbi:MAG: hypothetical protein ACU85V_00120 [Gammaproteobacteria bacterium]
MTIRHTKEAATETIRLALMAALDQAVEALWGIRRTESPGLRDEDLPELFRWIDQHVERLQDRHGDCPDRHLADHVIGSPAWEREREELEQTLGRPLPPIIVDEIEPDGSLFELVALPIQRTISHEEIGR